MKRLALAVLLLTSACARPKPGEPPEIVIGRHECARCGMIVSDERYEGGYVDDAGETVAYDDVGELMAAVAEKPELGSRAWVREFNGRGWLKFSDAKLVRKEGLATPMGTGWIALEP